MKESEEKGEANKGKDLDFPIKETKYQQVVEEVKQLIPFLIEEMKSCPSDDLYFSLIETVDFYSLKRNFKFKSKQTKACFDNSVIKFIEQFISNLSVLDSFISLPDPSINSIPIETISNKGNIFKPPKIFDINGDEGLLNLNIKNQENFLFIYDNINELDLFMQNNNINSNSDFTCFCIGIDVNFFETKKWLKNNGFINNKNSCFYFYFLHKDKEKGKENNTNIKLNNLPRIVHIDNNNIIKVDKSVKDLQKFEVIDLIYKDKNKNKDNFKEEEKNSNFVFLENDNKRKIIKAINIYLKEAGLNEVHFYAVNKICIDKNGIKKNKCYPAFYGETNKVGKNMVDNLVDTLNQQELFKGVQNKVNYKYTK